MLSAITAGTLFLSSLTAPVVLVPPPTDHMVIDVGGVNGSGCPAGTTQVLAAPDNTAFTVTYSAYIAQVGAGAGATEYRRNCQLALNVHVPQGFTYAISKTDYRGYAHLQSGAWGYQAANYYFQGDSQTARARHDFTGYLEDYWQTTDVVGVGALVWARCGATRYLNINTELRVGLGSSDPKTNSQLTMDSTDESLATIYHVAWKKC